MEGNSYCIEKKCRICAMDIFDGTSGISIFSDIFLEEKIKKYLYISISQTDKLPKSICGGCFIKLEGIHRFASLALKTEENFLTYLSRMKFIEERNQNIELDTATDIIQITSTSNTICETQNDFSDNNIKSHNRKINIRPYRTQKMRNPRHVDHITLEQIINDKIAKNFRSQTCEILPIKSPQIVPLLSYEDMKLGDFIKDPQTFKLIMKSLKKENYDNELIKSNNEQIKNLKFRELFSNEKFMKNEEFLNLLKSFIGLDTFDHIQNSLKMNTSELSKVTIQKSDLFTTINNKITQMEVRVDPTLFFPYDEEESAQRVKNDEMIASVKQVIEEKELKPNLIIPKPSRERNHLCTICPESFVSNVQLQEHIVKHLLKPKSKLITQFENYTKLKNNLVDNMNFTKYLTNDHNYECPVCKKKLSTKGNLKVHMNIHSDNHKMERFYKKYNYMDRQLKMNDM